MARADSGDLLKCSFCGKSQKQVKKLIAGPGVYICDECIGLCNEIIEEEFPEPSDGGTLVTELPKPREIRDFLDTYVIGQDGTIVQMVALGFLLYREPLLGIPVFVVGEWLLAAAAILTLWSGFEYARAAWPALRAEETKTVDSP